MNYKHTQIGHLMLYTLAFLFVYFGFIFTKTGYGPTIIAIVAFVIVIVASFSTLTTTVDHTYVRIKFGYGIFFKKFKLSEIKSVESVKNKWYFGWGIRFWFWPRMVIFNVSGFDAVELRMKNNKIYRIGTNRPKDLEYAIKAELKK